MALNFRSSVKYRNAYGGQTYSLAALSEITDSNGASNTVVDDDPAGTAVGITASATMTGYTVTYSLTNSAGGKYTINESTGVVYVGLVALVAGTDSITVRATANGQVKTKTFSITVTASGAYTANLWVDGATGNDSYTRAQIIAGGGTLKWQTLGRAMWGATTISGANTAEAAQAGDVVFIAAGIYSTAETTGQTYIPVYHPVNSGTSGNPIVFYADGVVEHRTTASNHSAIGVYQQNYITFAGQWYHNDANNTITGEAGGFKFWQANNIVLDGAEIYGLPSRGGSGINYVGVYMQGCDYITIKNCLIHDYDDGTPSQNSPGIMQYSSYNVIIENNEVYNCNAGAFIKGVPAGNPGAWNEATIRYNYVHNCGSGFQFGGVGGSQTGTLGTVYTDVYQNLTVFIGAAVAFNSYDNYSPRKIRIVNNTFIESNYGATTNRGNAVVRFPGPGGGTVQPDIYDDIIIENNISYGMIGWYAFGNDVARDIIIQNDVTGINNTWFDYFRVAAVEGPSYDYTAASLASDLGLETSGVVTLDPQLVDFAGGDYKLAVGSRSLNAGVDVLNLLAGGISAPINRGCYILADQSDVIGITP